MIASIGDRARRWAIWVARGYAHRFRHRGVGRVLLALHPPVSRGTTWTIKTVVPFDRGLRLHVDTTNWIGWVTFFYGAYRPECLRAIRDVVRPGAVAIDVGAAMGDATVVIASAAGPSGGVHAFEPWPAEFQRCQANLLLNSFGNVVLSPAAVSQQSGVGQLHGTTGFNQSNSSLGTTVRDAPVIRCEVVALDDYAREHNLTMIDFLKIDSQGADLEVLKGAQRILENWHPTILLTSVSSQLYRAFGHEVAEILDYLQGLGYSIDWLDHHGSKRDLPVTKTNAYLLARHIATGRGAQDVNGL